MLISSFQSIKILNYYIKKFCVHAYINQVRIPELSPIAQNRRKPQLPSSCCNSTSVKNELNAVVIVTRSQVGRPDREVSFPLSHRESPPASAPLASANPAPLSSKMPQGKPRLRVGQSSRGAGNVMGSHGNSFFAKGQNLGSVININATWTCLRTNNFLAMSSILWSTSALSLLLRLTS